FSDIRIGIQLSHAGRKSSARSPRSGGRGPLTPDDGAWQTVAPSAVPLGANWHTPAALDAVGRAKVVDDFVQAARRADRIGADAIELHAAHGYLLSSFLSPIANVRTDEYGGSLQNRMRFPLEVFEAVRAVWPREKALGVRINGTDWVYGGITPEEAAVFAGELDARGCDFIDVSSGGNAPASIPLHTGYQVPFAAAVRQAVTIPVMAVGLIRTAEDAQRVLDDGHADLIGVGRGHLHNPHWTWEAAEDLGTSVPVPYQYARAATRAGRPVERYVK
ncbi:MAG: oxidoreductase, partial [Microbacterium sp.]